MVFVYVNKIVAKVIHIAHMDKHINHWLDNADVNLPKFGLWDNVKNIINVDQMNIGVVATVLATTDFSESMENALEFLQQENAHLILNQMELPAYVKKDSTLLLLDHVVDAHLIKFGLAKNVQQNYADLVLPLTLFWILVFHHDHYAMLTNIMMEQTVDASKVISGFISNAKVAHMVNSLMV